MMLTKQYGGPRPQTSTSQGRTANIFYPSAGNTFSGVILRALDNRPPNEDKIRGVL